MATRNTRSKWPGLRIEKHGHEQRENGIFPCPGYRKSPHARAETEGMPTLFQPGWGFSRYSLTLPKLREENRARKILTIDIEGRGGGEDPGELQQPQGRDPGAAPHPTLALGRHHHSHHHVNATITNRVRESQRGKDRGRALTPGLRERERERAAAIMECRRSSVGEGWE